MHTRATCNRIQFAFVVIMIPNVIRLQFAFVLLFWFMIIVYREFPIITIMQSSGYTISKNVKTFFAVGKKGFFCCGVALLCRFLVRHPAPWHPKKGYARRRKTYILGFSETDDPSRQNGFQWASMEQNVEMGVQKKVVGVCLKRVVMKKYQGK